MSASTRSTISPSRVISKARPLSDEVISYDLVSGRYLPIGLDNEIPGDTYEWNYKASPKEYTPAALRRAGVR